MIAVASTWVAGPGSDALEILDSLMDVRAMFGGGFEAYLLDGHVIVHPTALSPESFVDLDKVLRFGDRFERRDLQLVRYTFQKT